MPKAQIGKDDPNVKIPAAIKALSQRSSEIHAQAYNAPPAEPEASPAEPAPEDSAAPAEPAPQTPATPAPAQPAPTTPSPDDWEHKFNSVNGRYISAQETIRTMGGQITELQRTIAAMQVQPRAAAPTPAQVERLVSDQEEQEYGQELLSVMGKKAKEELSPELSTLRAELAAVKEQLSNVGGYVAIDAKQRMFDALDAKLPNWKEVNRYPEFISWLGLPDEYSGAIRHELLKAAFEAHNAPRVLAFFNGFLANEAAKAPSGEPAPSLVPPTAAPPGVRLEDLAAPGRARTAAPSAAPAEKPFFTRANIAQFYRDVQDGKFRGRDEEKNRLESQIFEATREGRVQL